MEILQEYIRRIGGFLILQSLAEVLLPSHTSRKYIRMVLGAVFLLLLLQPVLTILRWTPTLSLSLRSDEEKLFRYTERIEAMSEAQYEAFLWDYGLPESWEGVWSLRSLEVECTEGVPTQIRVDLQASSEEEGTETIQIQLGSIGRSRESEEHEIKLQDELAAFWGVDPSQLILSLREGSG
jgi:stage III sporulation protein AF